VLCCAVLCACHLLLGRGRSCPVAAAVVHHAGLYAVRAVLWCECVQLPGGCAVLCRALMFAARPFTLAHAQPSVSSHAEAPSLYLHSLYSRSTWGRVHVLVHACAAGRRQATVLPPSSFAMYVLCRGLVVGWVGSGGLAAGVAHTPGLGRWQLIGTGGCWWCVFKVDNVALLSRWHGRVLHAFLGLTNPMCVPCCHCMLVPLLGNASRSLFPNGRLCLSVRYTAACGAWVCWCDASPL
jgi:hypothetical protein